MTAFRSTLDRLVGSLLLGERTVRVIASEDGSVVVYGVWRGVASPAPWERRRTVATYLWRVS